MALPALAVQALLAAGPSIIRGAGKLLGGQSDAVADTVATMVESAHGAVHPQAELDRQLASLSGADRVELERLAVEVKRIEAERDAARQRALVDVYAQTQQTARAEAASTDQMVRRTRPRIAMRSFWAGTVYVLVSEAAGAILAAWGSDASVSAQWQLAGLLYSPCLEYLGMRTLDKIAGKENAGDRSLVGMSREHLRPGFTGFV